MKANILEIMFEQLQPYLPFIAREWARRGDGGRGARHGDGHFCESKRRGARLLSVNINCNDTTSEKEDKNYRDPISNTRESKM